MNTWRDIKTAPLNQAVFATDGDMVFFGRFAMTADRKCMFEGQDIEEACNYGIDPACLTGWQPAPDTWKPEKSADEMFRELGYLWEGTPENGREYECVDYNDVVTVTTSDVDFHGTDGGYRFVVPAKLVLACAQLIKEMEVNNG